MSRSGLVLARSKVTCRFIQNSGEVPKAPANSQAVSGVTRLLPLTISLILVMRIRSFCARVVCVMPSGTRNSSRRISPG